LQDFKFEWFGAWDEEDGFGVGWDAGFECGRFWESTGAEGSTGWDKWDL
jgi:hypothetical protein